MINKRLIEVNFPLRKVSEESVRERDIRHGHISTHRDRFWRMILYW